MRSLFSIRFPIRDHIQPLYIADQSEKANLSRNCYADLLIRASLLGGRARLPRVPLPAHNVHVDDKKGKSEFCSNVRVYTYVRVRVWTPRIRKALSGAAHAAPTRPGPARPYTRPGASERTEGGCGTRSLHLAGPGGAHVHLSSYDVYEPGAGSASGGGRLGRRAGPRRRRSTAAVLAGAAVLYMYVD